MKPELPKGTRAERIAFARRWIRERRADEPGVRLTRARRRVIVAGLYLFLLATVSMAFGSPGAMPSVLGAGPVSYLIWLFTLQFVFFGLVSYSVRGLLMGDQYIDERERALRDHATVVAYRILGGAFGFMTLYVVAAMSRLGLPIPSTPLQLLWFLIPFGWLGASLPMSILAWTLPDPNE